MTEADSAARGTDSAGHRDGSVAILPMLFTGLDYVWQRLQGRLEGLSQDEYHWVPAEPSWQVRPAESGWRADYSRRNPTPAPITTIAWRMWHIGSTCLANYVSPALCEWPLPVRGTEWFGEVGPARQAMETSYAAFRNQVTALGEDGVRSKLGPDWGAYGESTWADLVVHTLDEVAHHGAEIALLRDLYPLL
ncbi:MAG: DinB family protein, partial [Actinobacteria bacterium]|nr:DinB family protein [Actinomycetota bacterium]